MLLQQALIIASDLDAFVAEGRFVPRNDARVTRGIVHGK